MGMPHVVLFKDTNGLLYASESENSNDPFNGHEYVDLGLPSGTFWATSVIKNKLGEPLYFQWGDTEGWTTEQNYNGEKEFAWDGSDYKWYDGMQDDGNTPNIIKYNEDDGKTVLDLEDDAAHVHMGGDWHMPTKEQWEELTANTTSTWTTQNGVNGVLFTSNVNGNSVFVPAFDYIIDGGFGSGYDGYVWSSSVNENNLRNACGLNFSYMSYLYVVVYHKRIFGACVLGVVG